MVGDCFSGSRRWLTMLVRAVPDGLYIFMPWPALKLAMSAAEVDQPIGTRLVLVDAESS